MGVQERSLSTKHVNVVNDDLTQSGSTQYRSIKTELEVDSSDERNDDKMDDVMYGDKHMKYHFKLSRLRILSYYIVFPKRKILTFIEKIKIITHILKGGCVSFYFCNL